MDKGRRTPQRYQAAVLARDVDRSTMPAPRSYQQTTFSKNDTLKLCLRFCTMTLAPFSDLAKTTYILGATNGS
jgi:hypothetical protein